MSTKQTTKMTAAEAVDFLNVWGEAELKKAVADRSDPTDTPTTARTLWCPKGPDGDLRLSMLGATMWLAWGQLEGSSGDDLAGLQKRGWRVVQVRVEEVT